MLLGHEVSKLVSIVVAHACPAIRGGRCRPLHEKDFVQHDQLQGALHAGVHENGSDRAASGVRVPRHAEQGIVCCIVHFRLRRVDRQDRVEP